MPVEKLLDPNIFSPNQKEIIKTCIFKKCHKEVNCLIWTGCKNSTGYPQIKIRFPDDTRRVVLSSRLLYALTFNVILGVDPAALMQMSHLCHNKLCIFVDHLVYEPQQVNNERRKCVSQTKCQENHHWQGVLYRNCILW
jgi:hypothetical protein